MTLSSERMVLIFKIAPRSLWDEATKKGVFEGSPLDLADGFIHFSTAKQMRATAARYFKGQTDLVLAVIDTDLLGDIKVVFELARNGDHFPHLYVPLPLSAVKAVHDLPLDAAKDTHVFPENPEYYS